jgi:PAS domain S-box-containing protein
MTEPAGSPGLPHAAGTPRDLQDVLRATLESTADGILVVDAGGRVVLTNERFTQMWRIPPDLLETRSDDELLEFVLDQLAEPNAFLSKVRELYGSPADSLDVLEFKDGRTFERYSRPLMYDGEPAGRVWSFRDVTERRRAEEQLRSAEARYRTLVEQIPAVSYIDAVEGPETTIYISPQTEAMLGFTQEEWLADPELLSKRIHPDDRDRWLAANARSDRTGEPFRLEYRIVGRDERVVWVRDEAILIPGEAGASRLWQGVMFDITERKQAEEALRQALERERQAAQHLRTLDEMKNMFLSAVSHELRTPLSVVLGLALTLEEDLHGPSSDWPDLIRRLANNARKLDRLLSDLLDVDRLAQGIVEPRRRPTDMAALVRKIVAGSDVAGDHPVVVDAEEVVVDVDGPKVERIVENLLANAARYTPAGTRLWLRLRPHEDGVLIAMEDEGPGVPEELRQTIFEPFRQGPNRSAHSPGVGIGLTLVSRFAQLHGGRAWVEDRPGGGASFRVYLPGKPAAPAAS